MSDPSTNHPFDLSDIWLETFTSHIFPGNKIILSSFTGNRSTDYWQYRYYKKPNVGRLKATAILPVANYYTAYNYPLYSKGGIKLYNHFYDELSRHYWDFLDFGPIPDDSTIVNEIINAAKNRGLFCETYYQHTNWYLLLNSRSFEEYVTSLPKRVRNTIKRKGSKLNATPSAELIIYSGTDAEKHIEQFQEVYEKSWKSEEGHPEFITDIMVQFAKLGWIRLGFVYLDGIPIASQFWIVKDDTAFIYKLAYVEGFEKLSAGTLLTYKLMEQVIKHDNVKRVDFLTGNDRYKKEWMSHCRELWGVRVYNRTTKGLLLAGIAKTKQVIKKLIKNG